MAKIVAKIGMNGCAVAAFLGATLVAVSASAAPSVWVIDDGEKIRRDAVATPFESGKDDPVWRPGQPVRLFAMRNESVALQVVVEADDAQLEDVTVDVDGLEELTSLDATKLTREARHRPVAKAVERFVEHFVTVQRPSGGQDESASSGWEPGSGPPRDAWVGPVPDALIPVEQAPSWDPYPMRIEPRSNGIVWIDVHVAREQAAGTYRGAIRARTGSTDLATIPVELEVVDAMLPDRTVTATAGYDHDELSTEAGPQAERALWQMLRAHRITPMHDATSPTDVQRQAEALDGSLYTRERGYAGPAPGLGDGVLTIGARGAFGSPDERTLAVVASVADAAGNAHVFGGGDVFLYAADEQCSSSWGAGWRKLLRESLDPDASRVRVGWTCTQDPTAQPVDVPILRAAWDPARVHEARDQGKAVWVYGGVLPRTGSLLLDDDAVSPRVNGWLQAMFGIPRWLAPDVAHWSDHDGEGRAADPLLEAETRLRSDGSWDNGGDVLVYPGKRFDAVGARSAGIDGVLPSIRLKNWRRGLEDAGYLQMAREKDPARADAVARWLVPAAFGEARSGQPAAWSRHGEAFFEARRALLAVALGRPAVVLPDAVQAPVPAAGPTASVGCTAGAGEAGSGVALVLVVGAVVMRRGRRRHGATGSPREGVDRLP